MVGLDGVRGQDRAVALLRRALSAGKLSHAYLFAGPAGVGKRTTALALAAALNCEREPGRSDCECGPCRKIADGVHPDLHRLAPEGAGNFIQIEKIRELLASLGFPPHEGRARLVLVESAHRMNPAAANAFLKTLEEPPSRTFIVLTTAAPEMLLTTIRSRCQRIGFAPLGVETVAAVLATQGVGGDGARAAARLAGGSVSRALELAGGETIEKRWGLARRAIEAAREGGPRAAIETAAALAEDKEQLPATLELLAHFYCDAALVAAGGPARGEGLYERELAAEADRPGGAARLGRYAAAVLDAHTAIIAFASAPVQLERMIHILREG